jgi:hypothetical protein
MILLKRTIAAVMVISAGLWAIPAFPGAEGWGKDATGGRGGQVIHVTNTNSYGAGSLANACGISGAKIIVFDVSGVIDRGNTPLMVNSSTTIAGQTSPNGITIRRGGIYASNGSNNIIIRHIRVQRAPERADGDCFRFPRDCHDIIVDHCSAYWCSDEVLDCSYSTYNITFQHTVVSSPLQCWSVYGGCQSGCGNNRTGVLSVDTDGRHTFYKCVLSHIMKRAPYLSNGGSGSHTGKTFEMINNVFYNNMAGSQESFSNNTIPLNLIGNYYKGGPNAKPGANPWYHSGSINPATMIAHSAGNYHFEFPHLTQYPHAFFNVTSIVGGMAGFMADPIDPVKTTDITDAISAYDEVLACGGAWPRDAADTRLMNEIETQTGGWEEDCSPVMDTPNPSGGTVPTDTDQDGMPDAWETAHSLNPNNASDRTTSMNGGYNAVEVYINELSDQLVPEPPTGRQYRVNTIDGGVVVSASPNPFTRAVAFTLANFDRAPVQVTITDIKGRTVFQTQTAAGSARVAWDGCSLNGHALAVGVYIARFAQGNRIFQKRVSLIR